MFIEWQEEHLFEEVSKEVPKYNPNTGDYLIKRSVDETLSEESFNNIDLDAI